MTLQWRAERGFSMRTGPPVEWSAPRPDDARCACEHACYLHDDGREACLLCACKAFTRRRRRRSHDQV